MDRMPEPGDQFAAFSPQPGRCFRMVYSVQFQADHCPWPWPGRASGGSGSGTEGDQWPEGF